MNTKEITVTDEQFLRERARLEYEAKERKLRDDGRQIELRAHRIALAAGSMHIGDAAKRAQRMRILLDEIDQIVQRYEFGEK